MPSVSKATRDSSALELPAESSRPKRYARLVYHALATVVRERLAIDGWGDDEYAFLRQLALGLHEQRLEVDDLVWSRERGLSREAEAVVKAVVVYMAYSEKEALAAPEGEDSDECVRMANDNRLLGTLLGLYEDEHPLALQLRL